MSLPSGVARADRPAAPQRHEVEADLDIVTAEKRTLSVADARYTFTPEALERWDDVVALLRRHVRRPSEAYARVHRSGSQDETIWTFALGGIGYLFDGRAYGKADAGIEHHDVIYDQFEDGFVTLPMRVELGGYPTDLFGVGGYYAFTPIAFATEDDDFGDSDIARSGATHEVGLATRFSTPSDRFYAELSAGWRVTDWEFDGMRAGSLGGNGPRARIALFLQGTPSLSYRLAVEGSREQWKNERPEEQPFIESEEKTSYNLDIEAGLLYWFEGMNAFGISLGGGYFGGIPTIVIERDRAFGKISVHFTTRF
jgi:hypothetical protein